jgi:DNA-binding NarL/FixJ family response regulator
MALSNRDSCLARIEPAAVELLTASLAAAAQPLPIVLTRLAVTELGLLAPNVLVVDVDGLDVDPLEMLRMLRFVLPTCLIAVYTNVLEETWALACHMAGANCLLSKASDATQVALGLRGALRRGCFTDPSFRAA